MRIFKTHLPQYSEMFKYAWQLMRHGKLATDKATIAVTGPLLPDIDAFDDDLIVRWNEITIKLHKQPELQQAFDACEHRGVPVGAGISIKFPGKLKPDYEVFKDTVLLTWKNPPLIYSSLTPEIEIDRVEFSEDHAVIVAGLFSIKVTW